MTSLNPDINMYHHTLNDKLTQSHYPHLAKKIFKNLALPPGLIVKNKLANSNINICHPKDVDIKCMDNEEWDKLFQLAEVTTTNKKTRKKNLSIKKKTRKQKIKNKKTKN